MKTQKISWQSIKEAFLKYSVPAVLIGIALNQIVLAKTQDLTSWKGGGFGMFASVDSPSTRIIRGYFVIDEVEYLVKVKTLLEDALEFERKIFINTQALPRETDLAKLGEVIQGAAWAIGDDNTITFAHWRPIEADLSEGPLVLRDITEPDSWAQVTEARLSIWKTTYSREQQQVIPELIATHYFFETE